MRRSSLFKDELILIGPIRNLGLLTQSQANAGVQGPGRTCALILFPGDFIINVNVGYLKMHAGEMDSAHLTPV